MARELAKNLSLEKSAADEAREAAAALAARTLAPKQPGGLIVISAQSAGFKGGNKAEIRINDVPVKCSANTLDGYRGLHIVLINPNNG